MSSQMIMRDARECPQRARAAFDEFRTDKLWNILNKRDGSLFTSFREFIETPEPYGWGCKWSALRPILVAEAQARGEDGEKSVQLDFEVEADGRTGNGEGRARDEKGQLLPGAAESNSTHREGNWESGHATAERLRAVSRASEPVRDLYVKGLIGVVAAASLGPVPKKPKGKGRGKGKPVDEPAIDPDVAARIVEATNAAVAVVSAASAPTSETEKRRLQRSVNAAVRTAMSVTAPDPVPPILRQLARLDVPQLERIVDEAQRLLLSKGNHAQT